MSRQVSSFWRSWVTNCDLPCAVKMTLELAARNSFVAAIFERLYRGDELVELARGGDLQVGGSDGDDLMDRVTQGSTDAPFWPSAMICG